VTFQISKRALTPPRESANRTSIENLVGAVNELSGAVGMQQQRALRIGELIDLGLLKLNSQGTLEIGEFSDTLSLPMTSIDLLAAKNEIHNSTFDWWQRPTAGAVTTSTPVYGADRFRGNVSGPTLTMQRVALPLGSLSMPYSPDFFLRMNTTAGTTAAHYCTVQYSAEGLRRFSGRRFTLSFWARANAALNIAVEFLMNPGVGGNSNGAASNGIGVRKFPISTQWARYQVTLDVPSVALWTLGPAATTSFGFNIWLTAGSSFDARSAALGLQAGVFDFAAVQLEPGAYATEFEYLDPGRVFAALQRYYEVVQMAGSVGVTFAANGDTRSSPVGYMAEKRATPMVTQTGSLNVIAGGSGNVLNVDLGTISLSFDRRRVWVRQISNFAGLAPAGNVVAWGDNQSGQLTAYIDAEF
jgi:hypothetical protein